MEKHLLVAISDLTRGSYALRTLRRLLERTDNLTLTLFYVAPKVIGPGGGVAARPSRAAEGKAAEVLARARRWLTEHGLCAAERVHDRVVACREGTVAEIVREGHRGLYDAALIGKAGWTRFEALFEDSVAYDMLWREMDFPLWICRRPEGDERTGILLLADGSTPSLRMADHLGFMFADQPGQRFTVLHVQENGGGPDPEPILTATTEALAANGVDQERIEVKLLRGKDVAAAVRRENARRGFAAIALGRRGNSPARMEAVFPSSLCVKLLRTVDDTSILISR
jgi:hypothetical protein